MPEIMEQVWWLLKKAGRAGKRNAQYYAAHPLEAWKDVFTYAKENPKEFALTCAAIVVGIAIIVTPLAIGFGAAGPILGSIAAGWQAGIGSVVAGSAFAVMQSMAMTGAFTAIGGAMIGLGASIPLLSSLFGRLRSWIGGWFGSDGPGPGGPFGSLISYVDGSFMQKTLQMTAGPDALLGIASDKPKRRWFLQPIHSKVDSAGPREEGVERRILTTNSKETWDLVWDDMDAWRDGTVKEHALEGFSVQIVLLRPKKTRGEEGFCEVFMDHETDCHPDCSCLGDLESILSEK